MEFNTNDNCLLKLKSSGSVPSTPFEAVVVAIHSILLNANLCCVYEPPSKVKGFSPSITGISQSDYEFIFISFSRIILQLLELSPRNFLPPNWNQDPTVITLMYKYRPIAGKLFTLTALQYEDTATITFSQRGGESCNLDIRLVDYTTGQMTSIDSMYQNIDV